MENTKWTSGEKLHLVSCFIGPALTIVLAPALMNQDRMDILFLLIFWDIADFILLFAGRAKRKKTAAMDAEAKRLNGPAVISTAPAATGTAPSAVPAPANRLSPPATIIVRFFKEKMGLGQMVITVNKQVVGTLQKGCTTVTCQTDLPYNIIGMGVYTTNLTLAPGDTAEFVCAGNGIRHDETKITHMQ